MHTLQESSTSDVFDALRQPLALGGRTSRNRVFQAPLSVCYADENGYVTPAQIEHYERRARGGTGTVVTENFAVNEAGRQLPRQTMVSDDRFLPGLTALAEAIHRHGTLAIMQIVHAGRYAGPWDSYDARPRLAPSAVEFPLTPGRLVTPTEISEAEIHESIAAFADAGARAERAGFDGVEIHGAQGFLISQFLSPHTNRRTDGWGGDAEGRFRFALEAVRAVRAAVSPDFVVGYHLLSDELLPGGHGVEEAARLAVALEDESVDFLYPVAGTFEALHRPENQGLMSRFQFQLPQTEVIKRAVSLPVIANGRLGGAEEIAGLVADKRVDAVALGRPLLTDPDWAARAFAGEAQEIRSCPCDPPLCIRTQLTGTQCHHWPASAQARGYFGLAD